MLTGIDVSEHQGDINWPKVAAAGAAFAICRATYGTNQDMTFSHNFPNVEAVGMVPGAYHFMRFNGQTASDQAHAFLDTLNGTTSVGEALLIALDIEDNGSLDRVAVDDSNRADYLMHARTWLQIVERELGRQALIYTGWSFWTHQLGSPDFLPRKIWIANYTAKPQPKVPKPWTEWTIWQHAADASTGFQGKIDGVTGDVDLNRFNGDEAALRALAKGVGTTDAPDVADPRPELQANVVAALQKAFNPFSASFGVEPLAVDGIIGPKTRAAMKLAGL